MLPIDGWYAVSHLQVRALHELSYLYQHLHLYSDRFCDFTPRSHTKGRCASHECAYPLVVLRYIADASDRV